MLIAGNAPGLNSWYTLAALTQSKSIVKTIHWCPQQSRWLVASGIGSPCKEERLNHATTNYHQLYRMLVDQGFMILDRIVYPQKVFVYSNTSGAILVTMDTSINPIGCLRLDRRPFGWWLSNKSCINHIWNHYCWSENCFLSMNSSSCLWFSLIVNHYSLSLELLVEATRSTVCLLISAPRISHMRSMCPV